MVVESHLEARVCRPRPKRLMQRLPHLPHTKCCGRDNVSRQRDSGLSQTQTLDAKPYDKPQHLLQETAWIFHPSLLITPLSHP